MTRVTWILFLISLPQYLYGHRWDLHCGELFELHFEHRTHLYDWILCAYCGCQCYNFAIFAGGVVLHFPNLYHWMDGRQNHFFGNSNPSMTLIILWPTQFYWRGLFQSMAVAVGAYESRWYDGHICYQKCLLVIIQACQRHQKLTLYKFSVASHAAFSTVSRQFHTKPLQRKFWRHKYIWADRGQFVETFSCTKNILWRLITETDASA